MIQASGAAIPNREKSGLEGKRSEMRVEREESTAHGTLRVGPQKAFDLTPHSEETFPIGRRAGCDSAITYEFSALGVCDEKRMSLRACHGSTYRWFFGDRRNRLSF